MTEVPTAQVLQKTQKDSLQQVLTAIKLIPTGGVTETEDEEKVFPRGKGTVSVSEINLARGHPISYPMEWFGKNNWEKPTLTLPAAAKEDSIESLLKIISGDITENRSVDSDKIKCFLHTVLAGVEETLTLDWVSMGVIIGLKGSKVTPFSLVKLDITKTSQQEVVTLKIDKPALLKQVVAFVTLITGCFRVNEASNQTYKTNLTAQLMKILEGSEMKAKVDAALICFADAYHDEELVKLFAVMDMFFNMFPKSPLAKTRVGTIILSYKDCSALASAAHGASIMLKTTTGFSRWLLTSALRADFYRINIPHQEVSIPYSYMPYMMALRLAEKSPYSASANPSLHLFIHLIGCAYGVKRSINALYVEPRGIKSILSNVYLFLYAHERTGDLQAQYYAHREAGTVEALERHYKKLAMEEVKDMLGHTPADKQAEEQDKEEQERIRKATQFSQADFDAARAAATLTEEEQLAKWVQNEPSSTNPISWLYYISQYNGAIPEFMKEIALTAWKHIEEPRPGTIGEYALSISVDY